MGTFFAKALLILPIVLSPALVDAEAKSHAATAQENLAWQHLSPWYYSCHWDRSPPFTPATMNEAALRFHTTLPSITRPPGRVQYPLYSCRAGQCLRRYSGGSGIISLIWIGFATTPTIPVGRGNRPSQLVMGAEHWHPVVEQWVNANRPSTKLVGHMGRHLMLWQRSEEFNTELDKFLRPFK